VLSTYVALLFLIGFTVLVVITVIMLFWLAYIERVRALRRRRRSAVRTLVAGAH
jgi:uncharacterized membrane protein YciS (DUF1049 family)